MPDSFFVTYGGNRVTLAGTPGAIAWAEPMVDVNLSMDKSWLKMRFVDNTGGETSMEVGSSLSATASASVPRNSTAYWTANGYQGYASSRQHVTAFLASGFDGVSADTSVTTAFYTNPSVSSYGSARLTASDSASAHISNAVAYKAVYGQGNSDWNTKISASSWAGNYDDGYDTASQRILWIPEGARISYMASSTTGRTFSFSTALTSISAYGVNFNHKGVGTTGGVTGYMNTARGFYLSNGRNKYVYGTGTAYQISNTSAKSASVWRAYTVATAFSSNLSTGSALDTYLNTTADAANVHGFSLRKELGQIKNSAGTWIVISGSEDRLVWKYASAFMSMSGTMSGSYSAVRAKGATANTTATASICAYTTASGMYTTKTGTFKAPTASGNTATTSLSVSTSRSDGGGANQLNVCNMFQSNIAQSTNLFSNCRGVWTASGRVE